jgi:amino acid adenylation domain-containing protein
MEIQSFNFDREPMTRRPPPSRAPSPLEVSYPLSPMQQGMLYHGLASPRSGIDINQLVCVTEDNFNVPCFLKAWERVIERHPILRTSLRWRDVEEPLQDVYKSARMPASERDLRSLSKEEQEAHIAAFLEEDRRAGFDLSQAPLMRLTLFRVEEARYKIVWTFHHVYLDGRSFFTALTEAFSFYEAIRDGKDLVLPVPRPFRDYIQWLRARSSTEDEAFWRETLRGFTSPTPLPIEATAAPDADRPINASAMRRRIPESVTARLRALAKEGGVTLNTVVQAAWGLLLARMSGQPDVVFGATRACRHNTVEGSDGMVGLLINTLPVRLRAGEGATVLSCLEDLRAQWIAMRDHEQTPLMQITKWSEVRGERSLFNTFVVAENYNWKDALRDRGGAWREREVEIFERTNFPLALIVDLGAAIELLVQYDAARFAIPAVERLLGHLSVLLEGMSRGFDQSIDALPWITPEEEEQLLVTWNKTERPIPANCIHHLIDEQARRSPDAIAVRDGQETLTYRELTEKASQIAHYLRGLGLKRGERVGISMPRSLSLAAGVLGILKAGCAYVPLDPAYPTERLAFMVKDAGLPVILSDETVSPRLRGAGAKIVALGGPSGEIDQQPKEGPEDGASHEDIAYVIYTSGSTGTPKGVLTPHGALVNHAVLTAEAFDIGPSDRVAQFSSISFDAAVLELFPTWMRGGALVMRPDDVLAPSLLKRWIEAEGITAMFLTTSFWHAWVNALADSGEAPPACLRLLIVGGEKASRSSFDAWQEATGGRARWINIYGPTETTVFVTYCDPASEAPLWPGQDVPIGRRVANTSLYVLDAQRRPVPIGVPGELYVGGVGVAKGYLNRPELTAERFIESPFKPADRLYKTGDRVRFLEDGSLEFLGRADGQVKIRGFRVELQEIESVLNRCEGVRGSAVLAVDRGPGDRILAAYVAAGRDVTADEVRSYLKGKLPPYMIPSAYTLLPALPMTPNGKVNKDALPKPDLRAEGDGQPKAGPRTFTEELLVKIWGEVLSVPVGVHDNFFDLGGHSLLMLRIVDKAAHAGLRVTPGQLFQHPTVAELAAVVSTAVAPTAGSPEWSSLVPLRQAGTRPPLFLIHTTPGDIFCYASLVSELGPDQPCYGLQSRGLHRVEESHTDISSMAAYYIEQIRAVRPKGPYYLGGWCYGGIVAVEMARQLIEAGEEVGLVAVMDAMAPRPETLLHGYYIDRLRAFVEMGPRQQLEYIKNKLDRARGADDEKSLAEMLEVEVSSGPLANRGTVSQVNLAAVRKHRARRFPGRITLFRASEPLKGTVPDRCMGWSSFVDELEIYEVPSTHAEILHEPQVKRLAEKLRAALDDGRRRLRERAA